MKIIDKKKGDGYVEMTFESSFKLPFLKRTTSTETYRKYGDSIFRYYKDGNFHSLGAMESINIESYFKIKYNGI